MYLVQFINRLRSLVTEFGFACNDGDASGVRPGGEDGQAANISIGINQPLIVHLGPKFSYKTGRFLYYRFLIYFYIDLQKITVSRFITDKINFLQKFPLL